MPSHGWFSSAIWSCTGGVVEEGAHTVSASVPVAFRGYEWFAAEPISIVRRGSGVACTSNTWAILSLSVPYAGPSTETQHAIFSSGRPRRMVISAISVLGGLGLLAVGAEGFVRGTSSVARRMGISPLIIGLTVVAYGTSAPELVVSVQAAVGGNPDIALGNVVGSNISNIGLILGGAALIAPIRVKAQITRLDVPIMIGVSALLLGLVWDQVVGRLNGIVLVGGAIAYTLICVGAGDDESKLGVLKEFEEGVPELRSWAWDLLYGMGGLALLVVGARVLVSGAVSIAEALSISTVVIGLTVVAIGTSLPELATSIVAARHGQSDLALGNVVGSNIFNILGILGLTACVQPIDASALTWFDGGGMLGFAVLTLPLLRTGYTFSRTEGGLLVGAYGGYLIVRVLMAI